MKRPRLVFSAWAFWDLEWFRVSGLGFEASCVGSVELSFDSGVWGLLVSADIRSALSGPKP